MMELFEMMLTTGLWAAVIRIATPLIFATLGELICERAGVLNLGIEGIMTIGAMAGWLWVYQGGDLWGWNCICCNCRNDIWLSSQHTCGLSWSVTTCERNWNYFVSFIYKLLCLYSSDTVQYYTSKDCAI